MVMHRSFFHGSFTDKQICELNTKGEDRVFYRCNQNKPPHGDEWKLYANGPDFWIWSKPVKPTGDQK